MELQIIIDSYLKSKVNAWSATTLKNERYTLAKLKTEHLSNGQLFYDFLVNEKNLKPYSVKTNFIRAGELVDYAMNEGFLPRGKNELKAYLLEHANKFSRAYTPKDVGITFEEALEAIGRIVDEDARDKAYELLFTGMRVTESMTLDANGQVKTKGGGHRDVPLAKGEVPSGYTKDRTTLYRHLKAVGLTPHVLRKLCATKLTEDGAELADLMKAMGWRSVAPAASYLQSQKQKELKEKMDSLRPKRKKATDAK